MPRDEQLHQDAALFAHRLQMGLRAQVEATQMLIEASRALLARAKSQLLASSEAIAAHAHAVTAVPPRGR